MSSTWMHVLAKDTKEKQTKDKKNEGKRMNDKVK